MGNLPRWRARVRRVRRGRRRQARPAARLPGCEADSDRVGARRARSLHGSPHSDTIVAHASHGRTRFRHLFTLKTVSHALDTSFAGRRAPTHCGHDDQLSIEAVMRKPAKSSVRLVGVLLVAWAIPAAVTAQSTAPAAIDEVRENDRLHLGPLYAKPVLQVKELGIDNNVFNTYGEQASDFTVTFAPRMDWSVPVAKRALFQATTAADLVWYAQYATERSVDPQLGLKGQVFFRRLTLFAGRDYLNTRQRPNQEIDIRARHVDE